MHDLTVLPPAAPAAPRRAPRPAGLLPYLARTRLSHRQEERARAATAVGVDWGRLLAAAFRHGVYPAVYQSLVRIGLDSVPPDVQEALQGQVRTHRTRCLMNMLELHRLVGLLDGEAIRVLPLKGPVLACVAYGSLVGRTYNDLDLLVPPEARPSVEALLRAHGYTPNPPASRGRLSLHHHLEGTLSFRHDRQGVTVDLHTRLAPRRYSYPHTFEDLWERREWAVLSAHPTPLRVRTLSRVDLVDYLCLHGTKHHWDRLKFVCDVAESVETVPALDWEAVLRRLSDPRLRRPLGLGLRLAHDVRGTRLPPDVLRETSRDGLASLAAVLASRLLAPPGARAGYVPRHLFQLRMRGTPAGKLRYAASALVFNRLSRRLLAV